MTALLTELPDAARIGVIGSDTTTGTLVVDLVAESRRRSINGRMVVVAVEDADGTTEYGLGTVTDIQNTNQYHANPSLRGVIAIRGRIGNLTAAGDIKTATVDVQGAFRPVRSRFLPIGGSLTFAPDTGSPVYLVTPEIVDFLATQTTKDLFYLGTMYRQPGVNLPMSNHDFSDARGAENAAFFGPSGSGKTNFATLHVGAAMRHLQMGVLLIDPQGQFTTNAKIRRELPLDLRALAEAQGRDVVQLSVALEVRLPDDPSMFVDMLGTTPFFHAPGMLGTTTKSRDVQAMVVSWLEEQKNWSEKDAETLLLALVEHVKALAGTGSVYAGLKMPENEGEELPGDDSKPANRLFHNLNAVVHPERYPTRGGEARKKSLLGIFGPFLNLFSPEGPGGTGARQKIGDITHHVTENNPGSVGQRKPRPLFILSLADKIGGQRGEVTAVTKALASPETQTIILRTLFQKLEGVARWRYQETDYPANVLVVMDEAARFTSVKERRGDERQFPEELGRYFRELRKYAVGFVLILQEPVALHESIWKQLKNGFRAFAGGLVGSDLDRVREQIGSGGALRLYQQLAAPSKDNPVYPFMLVGNASPLAVTSTPLFMEVFGSADEWARANSRWLPGMFNITDIWNGRNSTI